MDRSLGEVNVAEKAIVEEWFALGTLHCDDRLDPLPLSLGGSRGRGGRVEQPRFPWPRPGMKA